MSAEVTSGSWNSSILSFREQNAQNQVIEASHRLSCISFGHASVVFSQSDIPAVMQAVFDAPIGAGHLEELKRGDLFSPERGKAIFDLLPNFTGLERHETAFQSEDLLEIGPIQEILELAADRDRASF
jgi:hypothetical protein